MQNEEESKLKDIFDKRIFFLLFVGCINFELQVKLKEQNFEE